MGDLQPSSCFEVTAGKLYWKPFAGARAVVFLAPLMFSRATTWAYICQREQMGSESPIHQSHTVLELGAVQTILTGLPETDPPAELNR